MLLPITSFQIYLFQLFLDVKKAHCLPALLPTSIPLSLPVSLPLSSFPEQRWFFSQLSLLMINMVSTGPCPSSLKPARKPGVILVTTFPWRPYGAGCRSKNDACFPAGRRLMAGVRWLSEALKFASCKIHFTSNTANAGLDPLNWPTPSIVCTFRHHYWQNI